MSDFLQSVFATGWAGIALTGLLVGIIVGITGMGGGALMTPALIFLGFGSSAAAIVTVDIAAGAIYKTGGAISYFRQGKANLKLAGWLMLGAIPAAVAGPFIGRWLAGGDTKQLETNLKMWIGFALLFAAATYAARLYIQFQKVRRGESHFDDNPPIKPVRTVLIGMLGGVLVGITSVGAGSVIMICLLMLYPMLSPTKLVGTDLVQAVPLLFAAAIANITANINDGKPGIEWSLLIPLLLGSIPGTLLGAKIGPKMPQSWIRRGIVVVLTISGIALLDKAGWGPIHNLELFRINNPGDKNDGLHPGLYALTGGLMLVALPLVWGLIRKRAGLNMFTDQKTR